jgi:outer membrane biosynthesis protein TonB
MRRNIRITLIAFLVVHASIHSGSEANQPQPTPVPKELVFYAPRPDYPYEARAQRQIMLMHRRAKQGKGAYELHAVKDGKVNEVRILKSSGDATFDRVAVETLRWNSLRACA